MADELYDADGNPINPENDNSDENNDKSGEANNLNELKQMMSDLGEYVKGNSQAVKDIQTALSKLNQPKDDDDSNEDKKNKKGHDGPSWPENVEMWDRKQFADFILQQAKSMMEDQFKEVGTRVNKVEEETSTEKLRREADKMRSDPNTKDFDEWKQEMYQLFQNNPYLSMQQAYTLAKASDPDKAEKINQKYFAKKDSKEDDKESPFGGLTPAQKAVKKAKDSKKQAKGPEAGELAWQTLFGDKDDIM